MPAGPLVDLCKTLDQAKAVLTFIEAISEKTLMTTVSMTAARGRGKSAALGFAIAAAIAYGYANIFVTAPSPENLKTVFEMTFKALDALEYTEHSDYDIVASTNPDLNNAIVRINIFRAHRQTVQYIVPQDAHLLSQAELLVIDECAAIPLPLVKKLVGKYYLIFMSSTINGYEGTGRSLSLKLLKEMRNKSKNGGDSKSGSSSGRSLKEVSLFEPIRYKENDPVEKWLNGLLCLDCADSIPELSGGLPHPSQCTLYNVNRDTLFSYHKAAERFLQHMMALYVASHYKNTPNDLQLISDAPAHRLFVLLGPVSSKGKSLPKILCVVQVCLEGEIARESVQRSLARGKRAAGDLIPWCVSQQYQDTSFAGLSGARIVRIAVHPKLTRMGYASRAVELLTAYYSGDIVSLDEDIDEANGDVKKKSLSSSSSNKNKKKTNKTTNTTLQSETLKPKSGLLPMLIKLTERKPEPLHYLGVSYGLTLSLLNFWTKNGFTSVYLRQTANELTGEHTAIMLKPLQRSVASVMPTEGWLDNFSRDFQHRFLSLLGSSFRHFAPSLALTVHDGHKSNKHFGAGEPANGKWGAKVNGATLDFYFSKYDLKRMESYARNLVDYHLILDLVPCCAMLLFKDQLDVSLSPAQKAIVMGIGLQHKSVSEMEKVLNLENNQVLALFNKAMRKISKHLRSLEEQVAALSMKTGKSEGISASEAAKNKMKPVEKVLEKDLTSSGFKVVDELREKQRSMLEAIDLKQYTIKGTDEEWDKATQKGSKKVPGNVAIASGEDQKASGKKRKSKGGKKKRKSGGAGNRKRQKN
uniref:RNA cytidine acetyltransferase n=1 Tax=Lotharella globosa TaxID=91324 RepID=A0A7S3ZH00_9EUKA